MPLHSHVHADKPLSNFAVQYKNRNLIASMVAPFVPVMNKSDSYYVYTQADRFTIPGTLRGPKTPANEVDWSTSTSTYFCEDHALREFLPDAIVGNADPGVDPRRRTVEFITDLLLLDFEASVASLTTTAANYASAYKATLSGGDQWDSFSTSDPIANVETGKDACFVEPNVMIMGAAVWQKLKQHPQILDRVSGGSTNASPAMVTPELVAEVFELDKVLIGKAKKNTANKGQTASFGNVWGKDVVLAYVEDSPSLEGVSAFKTFLWTQMSTGTGAQVRPYRNEEIGGGGEYLEVQMSYDPVTVCSDCAYLIDAVVS